MKITMAEMLILMDTLKGSLRINDSGKLFSYPYGSRKECFELVFEKLQDITLGELDNEVS